MYMSFSDACWKIANLTCASEHSKNTSHFTILISSFISCLPRILGMPVDLQNRLFKYFTDTLAAIVTQAKKTGKYDMGILGEQSYCGNIILV